MITDIPITERRRSVPYVVCNCPAFGREGLCFEHYNPQFCKKINNCIIKRIIETCLTRESRLYDELDIMEVEDD